MILNSMLEPVESFWKYVHFFFFFINLIKFGKLQDNFMNIRYNFRVGGIWLANGA